MEGLNLLSELFLANVGYLVPIIGIFVRLSVLVFLLPGLGEISIPVRVRLTMAMVMTWVTLPIILPAEPLANISLAESFLLFAKESFYGFFLGFSLRIMLFVLQIFGNILAQALSLSQIFGEGLVSEPNTTISTLFLMAGVTLAVTADLHIMAVEIFVDSYRTFPFAYSPSAEASAFFTMEKAMGAFRFAVTLSIPFIILNFVYNLMLGFLNRAMPQLMVSFVGIPAITGAGLFLLVISSTTMLLAWYAGFSELSREFIVRP